jgi:hypothetical protein
MSEKAKWSALLVARAPLLLSGLSPRSQGQISGEKAACTTGRDGDRWSGNPSIPEAVIVIDGDCIKLPGGKDSLSIRFDGCRCFRENSSSPAWWTPHVHYQPWLAELFLNYGVTTIMAQGGDSTTDGKPLTKPPAECLEFMPQAADLPFNQT